MVLLSKLKENTNRNTVKWFMVKPLKTSCCLTGKLKTIQVWHFHCIPGLALPLIPNTAFRTTFQPTVHLDLGSGGLTSITLVFFFEWIQILLAVIFKFILKWPWQSVRQEVSRHSCWKKEKEDEAAAKGADFVLNKKLSRKQLCSLISFQAFQTGTSKLGTNGP